MVRRSNGGFIRYIRAPQPTQNLSISILYHPYRLFVFSPFLVSCRRNRVSLLFVFFGLLRITDNCCSNPSFSRSSSLIRSWQSMKAASLSKVFNNLFITLNAFFERFDFSVGVQFFLRGKNSINHGKNWLIVFGI